MKLKSQNIILLPLIVVLTALLPLLSNWTNGVTLFENLSSGVNRQLVYQSITLVLTATFLLVLFWTKRDEFLAHFRKGNISAPILPEPLVGIKP